MLTCRCTLYLQSLHDHALERVHRRAARWITNKRNRTTSVTSLLQQLHLEPLEECRRISRLTFLYKILNDMWRCRWIISIWFCVTDLSEDLLPSRSSRYLAVPKLGSRSPLLQEHWVEFITRFRHLVGFGIILQKPAVCYSVPVDVHTPLPQYPQEIGNYHPDPDPDHCNNL